MPVARFQMEDGRIARFEVPEGTTPEQANALIQQSLGKAGGTDSQAMSKAASWANEAIASVPDAVLNTPANVMNLAKAGYGAARTALGGSPDEIQMTPQPNLVRRAMTSAGLINPELDPTTMGGRLAKAGLQSAVAGAMAPASSVSMLMSNMGTSAASGLVGQGTTEATGSQGLGAAAGIAAVPAISALANRSAIASREAGQLAREQNAVRDETLKMAKEEGYVVPKSAVDPSFVNNRLESIAGKAAIGQQAAVKNQQVTNAIARREAGLAPNQAISEEALAAASQKASAPYREVAAISKSAAADLEALKQTRADANAYYKHYNVSADPASLVKAREASAQAATLEKQIEQAAISAGKPSLVLDLKKARQQIAKINDVERALNVATGDVSASILGRALDKGKPLTGGLETAGRFAQAFPSYAREGAAVPTPGVSKSEALASMILGLGGHAALGPMGWALAGAPLASGPIRSGLLSQPYQNAFINPSYASGALETSSPLQRAINQGLLQQ